MFESTIIQIMACRLVGSKPLSVLMMFSLLAYICAIRPQWVKNVWILYLQKAISGFKFDFRQWSLYCKRNCIRFFISCWHASPFLIMKFVVVGVWYFCMMLGPMLLQGSVSIFFLYMRNSIWNVSGLDMTFWQVFVYIIRRPKYQVIPRSFRNSRFRLS